MSELVDFTQAIYEARILLVDDELINVEILDNMLRQEQFKDITKCTDSREVLGLCHTNQFDLVVLDLRMPHLSGFDVMEQLDGKIEKSVPILVISGETDAAVCVDALQKGAKDFLTKPFDRTEALQRIRNLLETRLLYKEKLLDNAILESRVKERTSEVEETQLEIVRYLGRAVEFRDNETGLHILRMSKISKLLALAADLGEDFAELILNASPMHDIGKIGIPDNILLKPGKLDPEEWQVMQRHAEIGAKILANSNIDVIKLAAVIAGSHHEKWNGSGYPLGLEGDSIPVEGRICAIADVFDALTSERPYKEAWPVQKAIDLINEESGKHFDPKLVKLFNERIEEIRAIIEEYSDSGEASDQQIPSIGATDSFDTQLHKGQP